MRRKYLYENLFDDDELFSLEDDNVYNKTLEMDIQEKAKKVADLIAEIFFKDYNKWGYIQDDKIALEHKLIPDIDNDCIAFYYKTYSGDIYISNLDINIEINDSLQEIINLLSDLQISYVFINLRVYNHENNNKINIDFKDVQFLSYNLDSININNIIVDFTSKEKHKFNNYIPKYQDSGVWVSLNNCTLNDNILINFAKLVRLTNVKNINNFSFIKNVKDRLEINYMSTESLPKCNSLQGIPTGCYNLYVTYHSSNDRYVNADVQTLEGIHNNLNTIRVSIEQYPWDFLQHFSFKGLTKEILPKFQFNAARFKGKFQIVYIQLGPYKLEVKTRNWKPTKPQYETILKTQDWFLDCYLKEPHKEYVPLEYDEEGDKIVSREMKKVEKLNQKKQDAKEDLNKMVEKLKKTIKVGDTYYCNIENWRLIIKDITTTHIRYYEYKKIRLYRSIFKVLTFEEFVKQVLLNDNPNIQWRVDQDPSSKTLYQLICVPVQNARKRILNKRKEEEKKLKAEQKAQAKLNKKINEPVFDEPEEIEQEPVKTPKITDVNIVDYTDRSIAIIGNSYPIKDELKKLGAVWNKHLQINGQRKAGWILSKKKKQQVENLLY